MDLDKEALSLIVFLNQACERKKFGQAHYSLMMVKNYKIGIWGVLDLDL